MSKRSKLSVDVKVGETLTVGGSDITLIHKSGQLARLVVSAPLETEITTPRQRSKIKEKQHG